MLDFDGTVCLGDDPVYLYAEEASRRAGVDLTVGLAGFLSTGVLSVEGADAAPFAVEDGYQAIHVLGGLAGLERDDLRASYRASRARVDVGEGEMHTPDGFTGFLDEVRSAGTRVVLVTNAPLLGAERWLAAHDVARRLDAIVPDAGKPVRMPAVLDALLEEAGAEDEPELLASVGDVYANDIAPAVARGARAAHIDRFARVPGPATWRAPTFVELYEPLLAWATAGGAEVFTAASPERVPQGSGRE